MNQEVRNMLIERARLNAPVTYGTIMGQLGLDNENPADRDMLYGILGDISRFEFSEGRPLLSVMAKRADGKWGPGFFNLAEELEFGDAESLRRSHFAKEMQERCHQYWSQGSTLNRVIREQENHPEFFTQKELDFFIDWEGLPYEKDNEEHRRAKNRLMETVWKKTVYWSNQVVSRLENFETFNWRMWSRRGWKDTEEGKVQCSYFKEYTWARIYKKGDASKDIFFTVGYDAEAQVFVYKIDYYFQSDSYLSTEQQELCKNLRPENTRWIALSLEEASNWKNLIDRTVDFIQENESVYDSIVREVWGENHPGHGENSSLQKREKPTAIAPLSPSAFTHHDIDWEKQHREAQAIGRMGEELVLELEKKKLLNADRSDLAELVQPMPDGAGYDVASFNIDGSPLNIEVKTTIAGKGASFFITSTERLYSQLNSEAFCLFRLYNLNRTERTAEYFELPGNLDKHLRFDPILYRAIVV